MKKRRGFDSELVRSRPTMCLHCHHIVIMTHEHNADPVKGAWTCSDCGHIYPFVHWKIRKESSKP